VFANLLLHAMSGTAGQIIDAHVYERVITLAGAFSQSNSE